MEQPPSFDAEIEELLEAVFNDLDQLYLAEHDGQAKRALIESLFRRLHSIKGLASGNEREQLVTIAHECESVLAAVRTGKVEFNESVIDAIEDAANSMSRLLEQLPPEHHDFESVLRQLRKTYLASEDEEKIETETAVSQIDAALSEEEKHHAAQAVAEGARLFEVTTGFEFGSFASEFSDLRQLLEQYGEVIATSPVVDNHQPNIVNFRILYASREPLESLVTLVGNMRAKVILLPETAFEENRPAVVRPQRTVESIRLSLSDLDHLISSTDQVVRSTTQLLEPRIGKLPDNDARAALKGAADQIRHSLLGLADEIINLRMVSLERVLKHAERAGRAAARQAKVQVDFCTAGADVRIDRLLAEIVSDPLVHLVRNAVAHAIENADDRRRAGKPPRGMVRIEASATSNQSILRVRDDGRGINPELISRAAQEAGIVDSESVLDLERSLRLIFRPGFSTAPLTSTLSGRGFGLDVVETTIEQAGGEVRVSSVPGQGTTFELRLPVTFGLLRSLVIRSGEVFYCLDARYCLQIETIASLPAGTAFIDIDGERVPLFALNKLLGTEGSGPTEMVPIVLCQTTANGRDNPAPRLNRFALTVDEVKGTEEVLVRSLGRHSGRWYGIAGATELYDGSMALMLDLPVLVDVGEN